MGGEKEDGVDGQHIGEQNCQKVEKMAPYSMEISVWIDWRGIQRKEEEAGVGEEKVVEDRSLGSAVVKLITPRNCLN